MLVKILQSVRACGFRERWLLWKNAIERPSFARIWSCTMAKSNTTSEKYLFSFRWKLKNSFCCTTFINVKIVSANIWFFRVVSFDGETDEIGRVMRGRIEWENDFRIRTSAWTSLGPEITWKRGLTCEKHDCEETDVYAEIIKIVSINAHLSISECAIVNHVTCQ